MKTAAMVAPPMVRVAVVACTAWWWCRCVCLCRRRLWSPDGLLLMLPAMSACVATHAFPSLVGLESQLLDEDGEANATHFDPEI